jgi:cyclic pyranopterin phosphate synthase
MSELSHVAADGSARMVDIGEKDATARSATAEASVRFHSPSTIQALRQGETAKGDVFTTVRLAGIMGAKRTADLVPLCHPLPIDHVAVDIELDEGLPGLRITATVRCRAPTGVEMEALTAAAVAALTAIDMLKSVDRWISMERVRLLQKTGGRHGRLERPGKGG